MSGRAEKFFPGTEFWFFVSSACSALCCYGGSPGILSLEEGMVASWAAYVCLGPIASVSKVKCDFGLLLRSAVAEEF